MTLLYKLTDQQGQTYGGCQWGEGVEHTAPGNGKLCSKAWLHAYTDLLLAVLTNPVHGRFDPALGWEADGDVGESYGTKVGCTRLKTIRRITLPVVTTEQRVRFAILAAKRVCHDPGWNHWADRWLSGEDRSEQSAVAALEEAEAWMAARQGWAGAAARATADSAVAAWAANSAWATVARAAMARAAMAAMYAAAADATIDFVALAHEAVCETRDDGTRFDCWPPG